MHPTEIAFDIASAERALAAVGNHPAFGFNYDPSHFGYQGVDYVKFIRKFADRIFHVHMKDVAWCDYADRRRRLRRPRRLPQPNRYWDFKSVGRGNIDFEEIIRALNDIGYAGPLVGRVGRRRHGPRVRRHRELRIYVKRVDFPPSKIIFDAQFAE